MDEQWDNDLKKRIAEVFDNYEDTSADEGWLLLREKYPEKAKRRGIIWLWMGSAAAVLLLLLGIFWFRSGNNEQPLAHNKKQNGHVAEQPIVKTNPAETPSIDSATHQQAQSVAKNNIDKTAEKNAAQTTKTTIARNRNGLLAANHKKEPGDINAKKPVSIPPKNNQNIAQPNNEVIAAVQPKNNSQVQVSQSPAAVKSDTGAKVSANSYANVTQPGVDMQKEQAKKQEKNIFDDEKLADKKSGKKSEKSDKAVRLGVYAATYFNYAKGSSNQFNMGAGITSDISLSRNLKVSTGLSIGQNTLSYAGQAQAPQQSAQIAASVNAAAANTAAVNTFSPARVLYTATVTSTEFKNYNANLVGLDIPLNLKFVIDPQKSQTYILAGVSSGTFINEKYTYVYDNQSLYSSNISQTQDKSTSSSFNGFYFAKTLNVAFGTGYNIGSNKLVIEPFLKYPLDGLGSQQIKFGAGGINLKFNFNGGKK